MRLSSSTGADNRSPGSASTESSSAARPKLPALAGRKITPHVLRHTTACHLVFAGVDINTVRAWLGHSSIDATNIYAEINLQMKAEAMALCDVAEPAPGRPWKEDKDLMAFLNSY